LNAAVSTSNSPSIGHRARGLGEREDRLRDPRLKDARQEVGEQERGDHGDRGNRAPQPESRIERAGVGTDVQRPDTAIAFADRFEAFQASAAEPKAVRAEARRIQLAARAGRRVPGEHLAVLVVQRRRDDARLDAQRAQNFLRVLLVAKRERRSAVCGDYASESRDLLQALVTRSDELVEHERRAGEHDCCRTGQQHGRHESAP